MSVIKPGTYRHYKGGEYMVLGVARHSEDPGKELVVYRSLGKSGKFRTGTIWVRPKAMFNDMVVVNGKRIPRFRPARDRET